MPTGVILGREVIGVDVELCKAGCKLAVCPSGRKRTNFEEEDELLMGEAAICVVDLLYRTIIALVHCEYSQEETVIDMLTAIRWDVRSICGEYMKYV